MPPVKELATGAFSRKHSVSRQRIHQLVLEGRISPAPIKRAIGERGFAYFFRPEAKILPPRRKSLTTAKGEE